MANVKITSKTEFATLAAELKTKVELLKSEETNFATKLKSAQNFEDFDVSSKGNQLATDLENIYEDLTTASSNINNYANDILGFDVNDFYANGADTNVISYDDLFNTDGSTESKAQAIWNFLKYKGLSDAAAAGVLGNIQAECSFDLNAVGDGGTSYGLIQWHNTRWTDLNNFCSQNGLDPSSLQGQLEFLWAESLDPNTSYGKNLAARGFYTTESAEDAAVIFHDCVEMSASSASTVRSVRGGAANTWYGKFTGTSAGTVDGGIDSSTSWTSLAAGVVGTTAAGYSTGSHYSGGTTSSGSTSSGTTSSTTTTTTTTSTTTSTKPTTETPTETKPTETKPEETPETAEEKRSGLISECEPITAEKVKIGYGDKKIDTSNYKDYEDLGIKVTTGHLSYELSDEDVELLCSIIAGNGAKSYDEALSEISAILNRCENKDLLSKYGMDPIAQATNYSTGYTSGAFQPYANGKKEIPSEVLQAVKDALNGVRNHGKTTAISLKGETSTEGTKPAESTGFHSTTLDDLKAGAEESTVQPAPEDPTYVAPESTADELASLGIKIGEDSISN